MIDLCSNGEIIVGESVSSSLQVFAPLSNVFSYLEILLGEIWHIVAEFGSFAATFDLDFSCECFELINVSWSNFFFNSEQLKVELLLIGLLEEGHQKLACLEHLWSENGIQEALVVALSFDQLSGCLSFSFNRRQRWNDNLGVGPQEEVAQDIEVGVEAFDAPLHGEAINGDHHALILA